MRTKKFSLGLRAAFAILIVTLLLTTTWAAPREKVLHAFNGKNGANPTAGLIFDAVGNPYGRTLWSAGMETGDLSEWNSHGHGGGASVISGCGSAVASQDVAHSGLWSAKLTITTETNCPGHNASAVRMFRWKEMNVAPCIDGGCYYSAWVYFADNYKMQKPGGGFWNLMQFKSRNGPINDPIWVVDVNNRPKTGAMYARVIFCPHLPGPHSGDRIQKVVYAQTAVDIAPRTWVHFVVYMVQSVGYTGAFSVWQDKTLLMSETNVVTKYLEKGQAWSTNAYSDGVAPDPATLYLDDAVIQY